MKFVWRRFHFSRRPRTSSQPSMMSPQRIGVSQVWYFRKRLASLAFDHFDPRWMSDITMVLKCLVSGIAIPC